MKTIPAVAAACVILLAGCATQPRRFSNLNSGELVAVPPQAGLLVSKGTAEQDSIVTTGAVMGGPVGGAIAGVIAGELPKNAPAADDPLLKPYAREIEALAVGDDVLALYRNTRNGVAWLHASLPIRWRRGGENLHTIAEANSADGTASVHATVFLSNDMRELLAVAHVEVLERGAGGPTVIADRRLLRVESLDHANTQGGESQLKRSCLDRQHPRAAKQACAKLWFADDAYFLRNALKADMTYLQRDVVTYLNGGKLAAATD